MSDILLQKKASLERSIKQARNYYAKPSDTRFADDHYKQDAIMINLQRACEQCLDMANLVIRVKKLGLPAGSKDSFTLLKKASIIDSAMEKKLKGMVGFRNVIVHEYQEIDYKRVENVITTHADDLIEFASILVSALSK